MASTLVQMWYPTSANVGTLYNSTNAPTATSGPITAVSWSSNAANGQLRTVYHGLQGGADLGASCLIDATGTSTWAATAGQTVTSFGIDLSTALNYCVTATQSGGTVGPSGNLKFYVDMAVFTTKYGAPTGGGYNLLRIYNTGGHDSFLAFSSSGDGTVNYSYYANQNTTYSSACATKIPLNQLVFLRATCSQLSTGYYSADYAFYISTNGASGSWVTLADSSVIVPGHGSGTGCYTPNALVIGSYQGSGMAGLLGRYMGHAISYCTSSADFTSATALPTTWTPPPWGVYVNPSSNAASGGLGTSNSYMSGIDFYNAYARYAFLTPVDNIFTYNGTNVYVADVPPTPDILRAAWFGGTLTTYSGSISGGSFVTQTFSPGTLAVNSSNIETVYLAANGGVPVYTFTGTNAFTYGGLTAASAMNYNSDTAGVMSWVKLTLPIPASAWTAVTTIAGSGSTVTSVWSGSGGPITNVYSASNTYTYPQVFQNLDLTNAGVLPHVASGVYTYANNVGTVTWTGSPFPAPGTYATAYLTYPDLTVPSKISYPTRTSNAVALLSSTSNSVTFSGPLYAYDGVNIIPPGTTNIVSFPQRALSTYYKFAPTAPSASVTYTSATKTVTLAGSNPQTGTFWAVQGANGYAPDYAYISSSVSASYSGLYPVVATGTNSFTITNGPAVAIPDMAVDHAKASIAMAAAIPGSGYFDPTGVTTGSYTPGTLYVSPFGTANPTTAPNNSFERSQSFIPNNGTGVQSGVTGLNVNSIPGGVVQNIAMTGTNAPDPFGYEAQGNYAFGYSMGKGIAILNNLFGDMTDKHAFGNTVNLYGHARGVVANSFGGRGPAARSVGQQWAAVDYVGGINAYPSTMMTDWFNVSFPYNAFATDGVNDNLWASNQPAYGGHGGNGGGYLTLYAKTAAVATALGVSRTGTGVNIATKTLNTNNFGGTSFGSIQIYLPWGTNASVGDTVVIYDGVSSNTFSFIAGASSGTNVQLGAGVPTTIGSQTSNAYYGTLTNLYTAILTTSLTNTLTAAAGDIPAHNYVESCNWMGGDAALSWQAITSDTSLTVRNSAIRGTNGNMRGEQSFFGAPPQVGNTIANGGGFVNTVFAPNFALVGLITQANSGLSAGVIELLNCTENYSTISASGTYLLYYVSGNVTIRKTDCLLSLASGWGMYGALSGVGSAFTLTGVNQRYVTPDGSSQKYLSAYNGVGGGTSALTFSSLASVEPSAVAYASYAAAGVSAGTQAIQIGSPLVGAGAVSITNGLDVTGAVFNTRNSIGAFELPSLQVASIAATAQNRLRVTLNPSSIVALPLSLASNGFTLTYAGNAYTNFTVEYATTYNGFFDIVLPPGTGIFQTGTSTLAYVPGSPSIADAAGTPLLTFSGLSVNDAALPTVSQMVNGNPPQIPGTALTLDDVSQPTIASGIDNTLLLYVEPGSPQVVAFESSAYWPVFITAACPYGTGTLTFTSSLDAGNVSAYAAQVVRQENGTNTSAPTVLAGTTPRLTLESLTTPYLKMTATSSPVRVIITTRSPMTRIVTTLQI